jgi:hypothetical protein
LKNKNIWKENIATLAHCCNSHYMHSGKITYTINGASGCSVAGPELGTGMLHKVVNTTCKQRLQNVVGNEF